MSSSKTDQDTGRDNNDSAYTRIIAILERRIKECEQKADTAHARRKYVVYGCHKAIAMHLRKVRREFTQAYRTTARKAQESPESPYRKKRLPACPVRTADRYPDYSEVLEGREIVLTPPKSTLPGS